MDMVMGMVMDMVMDMDTVIVHEDANIAPNTR
jgi:hypothetical protein